MNLENYVKDLEGFIKNRLAYFVSEYAVEGDSEDLSGVTLKDFMDREIDKVTIQIDSAYISRDHVTGQRIFRVNAKMGNDTFCSELRVNDYIFKK